MKLSKGVMVSGGVRVGGAALVFASLVVGVRVLGASQFGLSVLALSVGQLVAFPLTAMERLVIRLVAQGDVMSARVVMRRAEGFATAVLCIGSVLSAGVWAAGHVEAGLFGLAASVTTASAGLVTVRQGACRAAGRLGWGQVPNEVFRPAVTMIAYLVAHALVSDHSGVVATLIASAATLVLILFAPRLKGSFAATVQATSNGRGGLGSAATSLMVVSVVALAVERLYPVVLGWTASAAAIAAFAVVLRVMQIANFAQAFAIFYYSPHVARVLSNDAGGRAELSALTARIRLIGLLSAVPILVAIVFFPGVIEAVFGDGLPITAELRVASVGILASTLGGPAQTLLIMSGREQAVAVAYAVGAFASAIAYLVLGGSDAFAATTGVAVAFTTWNIIQVVTVRRRFGNWH